MQPTRFNNKSRIALGVTAAAAFGVVLFFSSSSKNDVMANDGAQFASLIAANNTFVPQDVAMRATTMPALSISDVWRLNTSGGGFNNNNWFGIEGFVSRADWVDEIRVRFEARNNNGGWSSVTSWRNISGGGTVRDEFAVPNNWNFNNVQVRMVGETRVGSGAWQSISSSNAWSVGSGNNWNNNWNNRDDVWLSSGSMNSNGFTVFVNDNWGNVQERGVVISRSTSSPSFSNNDGHGIATRNNNSVTFTNLRNGDNYWVRGYIRDNNGNTRWSNQVATLRVGDRFISGWDGGWNNNNNWNNNWNSSTNANRDRSFIETRTQSNVTPTSATLSANIANMGWNTSSWSNQWNERIIERGFVWSTTNRMPTLGNSVWRENSSAAGNFSATVSELQPNTQYFVSAFFRTPNRTFYGNVISFTTTQNNVTPGANATVNITFTDLDGNPLGTSSVNSTVGATINQTNLNVPAGFVVWPVGWSYTVVSATDNITVLLNRGSITPPNQTRPEEIMIGNFFPTRGSMTFQPDAPVTRGEMAQALFNLYAGRISPVNAPANFSDSAGTPFATAIEWASSVGFMNGYPNGKFIPGGQLSRAEGAAIMVNIRGLSGEGNARFTDLQQSHWAFNQVALAADHDLVSGFPNGTFGPMQPLTRAQALALVSRLDNRALTPIQTDLSFNDVPTSHWAYDYIMSGSVPRW